MKAINQFWSYNRNDLLAAINSRTDGLTNEEAKQRLSEQQRAVKLKSPFVTQLILLGRQYTNPLILLLIFAAVLSGILKEYSDSAIILAVLLMMGVFSYLQNRFADKAVRDLQKQISHRTSVLRNGAEVEVNTDEIVQGDIIILNAGDIIPADGLLIECNDLHVNESTLTGESYPVEKSIGIIKPVTGINEIYNAVFEGTSVVNGTAKMLAVNTRQYSQFGKIATRLSHIQKENSFEKGIVRFGYMILYITLFVSLFILILNVLLNKPVFSSLLFSLAIAVGLAPELLPAIMTVTMATGAKTMAKKNVIIKKLDVIQNLGQLDVLCCDKTGTITEGVMKLESCLDYQGNKSEDVKRYAFYNAFFETGFNNPIDDALRSLTGIDVTSVKKTDEVPYDFIRKRLSVVIEENGRHIMITKGAVKNVMAVCSNARTNPQTLLPIDQATQAVDQLANANYENGLRCIGLSIKDVSNDPVINKDDECEMTFLGLLTFEDPLREGVLDSVNELKEHGIQLKLITGDNMIVARHIASKIGIDTNRIICGDALLQTNSEAMQRLVLNYDLFAETDPSQKEAIVNALQANGHTVGFLGDGINDAQALKSADVGISVNSAADVARESASVMLLNKNLDVLLDSVLEGRKTFVNTQKYIFLTTSANFGNMFSMAIFSVALPFLPLLPTQILLNNFLSDIPTLALGRDYVDPSLITKPCKWNIKGIKRFMLVYGIQSSLFDMVTFYVLLHFFKSTPETFRTAWFLESLLTEVVIIFIIRTTKPFYRSKPSEYLVVLSLIVVGLAAILPFSGVAVAIGMVPLPFKIFITVVFITVMYGLSSELLKRKYLPL